MTIQEAIIHCEEKAQQCNKCSEEHRQLANWLKELSEYHKYGTVEECREAMENQRRWIPCSESLPKKFRDEYGELIPFLVCTRDGEVPFRALYDGKSWGDGMMKIDVIAWMELPVAYKEGDQSGNKEDIEDNGC